MTFIVKSKHDYGDAVEVFGEKYVVVDIEITREHNNNGYFICYLLEAENRERVWVHECEVGGKWEDEE